MVSVEILVILPVAALHLAVVPWRVRLNEFVPDAWFLLDHFNESFPVGALGIEPISKLRAIIRLDAFDGEGKAFFTVFDKL